MPEPDFEKPNLNIQFDIQDVRLLQQAVEFYLQNWSSWIDLKMMDEDEERYKNINLMLKSMILEYSYHQSESEK